MNRIVLGGGQRFRAERLDVKGDRGADIGKRLLVYVALADDRATHEPERISDVAVSVLFDHNFQLSFHQ